MKKRERKRRAFFWFSLSSVLLLLVSLTAAAMLGSSDESANNGQTLSNSGNPGYYQQKTAGNKMQNGQMQSDHQPVQELNTTSASSTQKAIGNLYNQGSGIVNGYQKPVFAATKVVNDEVSSGKFVAATATEEVSVPVNSSQVSAMVENIAVKDAYEWIMMYTGRGIADEYVFHIEPTQGSVLPEFVPYNPPHKFKFNPIFELNVTTAGNGYKYFRESKDITVAGNHRFSQYQAMMLFDMGRGVNIGTGVGYLESVGIGKALVSEWIKDSTTALVRVTKAENLSYRLNKLSIPLGIRYQLGFGRSIVRISATAMPGMVTLSGGNMFSRFAIQSMDNLSKNAFSFDARFGAGLYYQVSPKAAISAEPMLQYQSIPGAQWKSFRRLGYGFGLGVVFKP
jgi:archaellum component FlaF (FlaF/FlaG flagellin family)